MHVGTDTSGYCHDDSHVGDIRRQTSGMHLTEEQSCSEVFMSMKACVLLREEDQHQCRCAAKSSAVMFFERDISTVKFRGYQADRQNASCQSPYVEHECASSVSLDIANKNCF